MLFIGEDTNAQYKYKYTIRYPKVKEIFEEIAEVCGELSSSSCVPLEAAEVRVRDLMLRSGRKLLEVCVSQAASQQSAAPGVCPECKQSCRPIQKRGVNIIQHSVARSVCSIVYECECVSGHYHRLGICVKGCKVNGHIVLQNGCVI